MGLLFYARSARTRGVTAKRLPEHRISRQARPTTGRPARPAEVLESRVLMSTYHLSPAGSDSAAGTPTAPWRTLAKAAATVSGGDEIVLRAGTYAGGVQFNDPNLLIRSYPGERAAISSSISSSSTQQTISLGVNASGTTLRGLEITGGYYYSVKLETDWSNGRFSR